MVVADKVPFGCTPATLAMATSTNNNGDYDQYGCRKSFNRGLSQYHNALLRRRVDVLRRRYPHTRLVFAEQYRPVIAFLKDPDHFGELLLLHNLALLLLLMFPLGADDEFESRFLKHDVYRLQLQGSTAVQPW
jgi:hypothetical protein